MNEATQALIAILAALGGGGFVIQAIGFLKSWREGAKLRADEADERLVKRLEDRIAILEMRADLDADYIRRLVHALGTAGISIPSRKEMPDGPERKTSG